MAGNAHANRQRRRPSIQHRAGCVFCTMRPPEGKRSKRFSNSNGNRKNPTRKRRSRSKRLRFGNR